MAFSADFPLMFHAGLHARPVGHLSGLGLTIDGKPLEGTNPDLAEYEYPNSDPNRVVRLAANTGDPEHDRRLVQYGKATIQSGDGPFRAVANPMSPAPEHVSAALQSLEADPDWQPFVKVGVTRTASMVDCPTCHNQVPEGTTKCTNCGHRFDKDDDADDYDPDKEYGGYDNPAEKYDDDWQDRESSWHEADYLQQYQQGRGDFGSQQTVGGIVCPNCGTMNPPGAGKCAKCGAMLGQVPGMDNQGGPSNAYSNPLTGNPGNLAVASEVKGEMTSKWHLADMGPIQQPAQPETQTGPFNDHRDIGGMSPEQAVGHERLVNIVVDEMNKAIQQGGAIDATLVQNLVTWLVDKFGQDANSAQAIVDAASKQAQTSDGRLDTPVVPDPAEAQQQAVQPGGDQVSDPTQAVNNGAFSHVRTPSLRVGHIVDRWEDMYGEKWAMVEDQFGYKESVYEDELENVDAPAPENPVEELHAFIEGLEPVEPTLASVQARMANVKLVKQEIRRHMINPRLSIEDKLALDNLDAEMQQELLELTDVVPTVAEKEQSYLQTQPKFSPAMAEDVQPTMFGVEELQMDEAPEPEWTSEALDAFAPEEAEVLVSELPGAIRSNPSELAAVAAAHIDSLTAGHDAEIREYHRSKFIESVHAMAADYSTSDEPLATTEEQTDWDGPAEGIFA